MKIENWTAEDACNGSAYLVKDGHLWRVSCVHFDGTVEVACMETIKPSERHEWVLHRPDLKGGGS